LLAEIWFKKYWISLLYLIKNRNGNQTGKTKWSLEKVKKIRKANRRKELQNHIRKEKIRKPKKHIRKRMDKNGEKESFD